MSQSQGKLSENKAKYDEALTEVGIADDILRIYHGKEPRKEVRREHLNDVKEAWKNIEPELQSINEETSIDELRRFLENSSNQLETSISFLIGAHFLAQDAAKKAAKAKKEAKPHVKKSIDAKRIKSDANKVSKGVVKTLKSIDEELKIADLKLRQNYGENSEVTREEIRFLEDAVQSITEFISTGEIQGELGEKVRKFIKNEVELIQEKEQEKMNRSLDWSSR